VAFCVLLGAVLCCGAHQQSVSGPDLPPQAPQPEVIVEEVQFRHGRDLLSGNLYRPGVPGRWPAVALVLGSGAHTRDYGGTGSALGYHFARNGIVCLVWDKSGVGKSTGDFNAQTFRDRAEEALAAVRWLRARPDVRADRVGLWGHSQGGMVVPLAASLSSDVAFVIAVAGWQGPAWTQDPARVEAELRANHFPEAEVAEAVAFARWRMEMIRGAGSFEELDRAQVAMLGRRWFAHVHRCDRTLFESVRHMVEYDSAPSWERVRCPVLVIYGDADTSSGPPGPLIDIIRRGLEKGGNRAVEVIIFPRANHSLCLPKADTPRVANLRTGPDFVPGYLDTMTDWLNAHVRPGASR
jgi:pimeloyl-ACP methyl ester carboxylesterase